jgi:hypothetical protein
VALLRENACSPRPDAAVADDDELHAPAYAVREEIRWFLSRWHVVGPRVRDV